MLELIPWTSLFGGILLGVSAVLLMLVNGKTAGISGIVNGIIIPRTKDWAWRVLFVVGMVIGGGVAVAYGHFQAPDLTTTPVITIVAAGALVGLGTKIGNGCTSGHGICGIGRLSPRSIIATCIFMAVAALTVYLRLHV
ncbi:YeeE/YedE family protein [Vibrio aquaticus]|uniref:YeeE/YedE family protein n=1 Tax=Vibrio aquaticus TaxID=2496559 RepID=A0A3S0PQI1_9VIBR|nr:YeeE/YedE thiosulfate transporter family protein [Vibrio aquaticus]RTZ17291.1 YeeE/YedE family protein [Vibrio aquaticus]